VPAFPSSGCSRSPLAPPKLACKLLFSCDLTARKPKPNTLATRELASSKDEVAASSTVHPLSSNGTASAPGAQKLDRALHILVVDDQPDIYKLLSDHLSKDWHTIETAANGREALQKLRIRTFDVIITDKSMPEMDGEELALEMKRLKPSQRIILLTGELSVAEGKPATGIDLVLRKPASLQILRQALLDVMFKQD
jgi:CheY-like chemotaxis protein